MTVVTEGGANPRGGQPMGESSSVVLERCWEVGGFAGIVGLRFVMRSSSRGSPRKLGQPRAKDGSPLGSSFGWHRLLLQKRRRTARHRHRSAGSRVPAHPDHSSHTAPAAGRTSVPAPPAPPSSAPHPCVLLRGGDTPSTDTTVHCSRAPEWRRSVSDVLGERCWEVGGFAGVVGLRFVVSALFPG